MWCNRREERQANGQEADSDLEDEEEVEAAPDEDEAHHKLLSCMSLSKMIVDYRDTHKGSKQSHALQALVTNVFNTLEVETWCLDQVSIWPLTLHASHITTSTLLVILLVVVHNLVLFLRLFISARLTSLK
jgi:hypothetical protein